MKKTLFALTLAALTTLASMQKSHAIVAICAWNPPLIGAGLLIATVGGAVGGGGVELINQSDRSGGMVKRGAGYLFAGVGAPIGILGMIVLEDGSPSMEFSPVTTEERKLLGLNQHQVQTFNAELDQVNMIMQQVTGELNHLERPTAKDVAVIFDRYDEALSSETIQVLQQISRKLVAQK